MRNDKPRTFSVGDAVIYRGKTYCFPGHVSGLTDDGQVVVRAIGTPEGFFVGMKHIFGPSQLELWDGAPAAPAPFGWVAHAGGESLGKGWAAPCYPVRVEPDDIAVYRYPPAATVADLNAQLVELQDELDQAQTRNQELSVRTAEGGLIAFAKECLRTAFEGESLDGGDIQELGVKHALLREVNFDKAVHRDPEGYAQNGDQWFTFTDLLAGDIASLSAENKALRLALGMPDAERRLWFISERLRLHGYFNRADICQAFGTSVPQASLDIQRWIERHPGEAAYNPSTRRYEKLPPASTLDASIREIAEINAAEPAEDWIERCAREAKEGSTE